MYKEQSNNHLNSHKPEATTVKHLGMLNFDTLEKKRNEIMSTHFCYCFLVNKETLYVILFI